MKAAFWFVFLWSLWIAGWGTIGYSTSVAMHEGLSFVGASVGLAMIIMSWLLHNFHSKRKVYEHDYLQANRKSA